MKQLASTQPSLHCNSDQRAGGHAATAKQSGFKVIKHRVAPFSVFKRVEVFAARLCGTSPSNSADRTTWSAVRDEHISPCVTSIYQLGGQASAFWPVICKTITEKCYVSRTPRARFLFNWVSYCKFFHRRGYRTACFLAELGGLSLSSDSRRRQHSVTNELEE